MPQEKSVILILTVLLLLASLLHTITIVTLTGRAVDTITGETSICLNQPPAINTTITRQRAHFNTEFSLQVNGSEPDDQTMTYFDNTTVFNISSTTGLINFTPDTSQNGSHHVLVTVTDNGLDCPLNATNSFILDINNSAPLLDKAIPNQTWEEDVTLTGLDLDDYFTDADNDTLNYTAQVGDHVTVTINNVAGVNKGKVTFKPEKDWYGISWAIFTANDSASTVDSNNVTLNVTAVANVCGDGLCNSGEDCSRCSTDCGACVDQAAARGGGGGPTLMERIIREPTEAICEIQAECTDWTPASCLETAIQQQTCLQVDLHCGVRETLEERPCVCQSEWKCSLWIPESCPAEGIQRRTCLDVSDCGHPLPYLTERTCISMGKVGETKAEGKETGAEALAGGAALLQALRRGKTPLLVAAGAIASLSLISLGISMLRRWKRRREKAALVRKRKELLQKIAALRK